MKELSHVIFLALLPLSIELGCEVYRTKVLGRRDKHPLTAFLRLVVMLWGSFSYDAVPWIKTLFVMVSIHYLGFNLFFNRYALGVHWSYLGKNFLDNLQKEVPPYVLLALKALLVVVSCVLILRG